MLTRLLPLLLASLLQAADRGEEIRLWTSGAPGFESEPAPEVFKPAENPKLPKQFSV